MSLVILVGQYRAGKSSMMTRWVYDTINPRTALMCINPVKWIQIDDQKIQGNSYNSESDDLSP